MNKSAVQKVDSIVAIVLLAFCAFSLVACPPASGGTTGDDDDDDAFSGAPKTLWGKWTRTEASAITTNGSAGWYVTDDWVAALATDMSLSASAVQCAISETGTDYVVFESGGFPRKLRMVADYAVEYDNDLIDETYAPETLFRFGGEQTDITATTFRLQETGSSSARPLGSTAVGGIRMIARNIRNPSNQPPERTSGSNGVVTVPEIILGEEYTVSYIDTAANNATYSFNFSPTEMNQDIGNLVSSGAAGVALKVTMEGIYAAGDYYYARMEDNTDNRWWIPGPDLVNLILWSTGANEPASPFNVTVETSDGLYLAPYDTNQTAPSLKSTAWTQTPPAVEMTGFTGETFYIGSYWMQYAPGVMLDERTEAAIQVTSTVSITLEGATTTAPIVDLIPLSIYRGEKWVFYLSADGPLDYFLQDPEGKTVKLGRLAISGGFGSAWIGLPYRAGLNAPDDAYNLTLRHTGSGAAAVNYGFSFSPADLPMTPDAYATATIRGDAAAEPGNNSVAQIVNVTDAFYGVLSSAADVDRFAARDSGYSFLVPTNNWEMVVLGLDQNKTTTDTTPVFRWPLSAQAASYELQIATVNSVNPTAGQIKRQIADIPRGDFTLADDLKLPYGAYYFRVRARTAGGDTSVWSVFSEAFLVKWIGETTAPTSLAWSSGTKAISWNAIPEAEGYCIEFTHSMVFDNQIDDANDAHLVVYGTTSLEGFGSGQWALPSAFNLTAGNVLACRVYAFSDEDGNPATPTDPTQIAAKAPYSATITFTY